VSRTVDDSNHSLRKGWVSGIGKADVGVAAKMEHRSVDQELDVRAPAVESLKEQPGLQVQQTIPASPLLSPESLIIRVTAPIHEAKSHGIQHWIEQLRVKQLTGLKAIKIQPKAANVVV
jgi:hypothetical protein